MRPPYPICMALRLVFIISIQLVYSRCSSSPQFNFSIFYAMIMSSGDSGHVLTSAIDLRSYFASAIPTFSAPKYKMNRSPLRAHSPREHCIALWNWFLVLISDWYILASTLFGSIWLYFPVKPTNNPRLHSSNCPLRFLLSAFPLHQPCTHFILHCACFSQNENHTLLLLNNLASGDIVSLLNLRYFPRESNVGLLWRKSHRIPRSMDRCIELSLARVT